MNLFHKSVATFWKHISRFGYNLFQFSSYQSYLHNKKASK